MRKTIVRESSKATVKIGIAIIVAITIAGLWFKCGTLGNIIYNILF